MEYYNKDKENEEKTSYSFQYIISYIIPLVGLILGAILLSKEEIEEIEERDIGKKCIIIAIISMIINTIIISIVVF